MLWTLSKIDKNEPVSIGHQYEPEVITCMSGVITVPTQMNSSLLRLPMSPPPVRMSEFHGIKVWFWRKNPHLECKHQVRFDSNLVRTWSLRNNGENRSIFHLQKPIVVGQGGMEVQQAIILVEQIVGPFFFPIKQQQAFI